MKLFKTISLICSIFFAVLKPCDFSYDEDGLATLSKEELQFQSKIIARQILAELNPDSFEKIRKHGFYGLCAAISGVCVGTSIWGHESGVFGDMEEKAVIKCSIAGGAFTLLWSWVLLEILDSTVFDSARCKKEKLLVLEKLNQILKYQDLVDAEVCGPEHK